MTGPHDRDAEGRDPEQPEQHGQHGQHGPEDFDRQWQQIVAGLGPLQIDPQDAARLEADEAQGRAAEPAGGGNAGPRDYTTEDLDDGDFVAPEPPAFGSGDPAIVLSMIGVAGAPVALLLSAVFWPSVPGAVLAVLMAAFVAGAVGLFFALPRDRDRDGPGDDGARL